MITKAEIQRIKHDWKNKGFTTIDLLTEDECDRLNDELDRLRIERNKSGNWGEYEPYQYPQRDSELLEKYFVNPKLLEIVHILLDTEKIIGLQDWAYFKKPGELGRDMHQNAFYTGCKHNEYVNMALALDNHDKENGAVWNLEGTHRLPILPIEVDEERVKTNPKNWSNERGKPCVLPEGHDFKKIEGKAADNISYLSPNMMIKSGLFFLIT